jgi:hypothetical protein
VKFAERLDAAGIPVSLLVTYDPTRFAHSVPPIHDQLVSKVAALAATPASAGGEAIPLRIDIPATASIELWDSGLPVSAHAGDTLPTLAATYHVPLWALTQVNNLSDAAALTKGERIIVPRYLVPMAAPSAVSSHAASNRR